MEFLCEDIAATHAHAAKLALGLSEALRSGRVETVVVGLDGPLGAGKTEWVRGFMAALGPDRAAAVCSPTYAIMQVYEGTPEVRHLDLYRLGSVEDLEAIGYRDAYYAPGITLVEWIDNIEDARPIEWIEIGLAVGPTDVREIRIRPHSPALAGVLREVYE